MKRSSTLASTRSLALSSFIALAGVVGLGGCSADATDGGEEEPGESAASSSADAITGCGHYYYNSARVTCSFTYLRWCPYASCAPREGLAAGRPLSFLNSCPTNGYYYVQTHTGVQGWVLGSCLADDGPQVTIG